MDEEDLLPQKARPKPKSLDGMGIAELEAYIAELEAEISRVREAIAGKKSHKGAADKFFKR